MAACMSVVDVSFMGLGVGFESARCQRLCCVGGIEQYSMPGQCQSETLVHGRYKCLTELPNCMTLLAGKDNMVRVAHVGQQVHPHVCNSHAAN
eukprot:563696-Pyramimonas_sp.AAC.1